MIDGLYFNQAIIKDRGEKKERIVNAGAPGATMKCV